MVPMRWQSALAVYALRRLLPPWKTFGLDFSPMIVILLIQWAIKPLLWTLVG